MKPQDMLKKNSFRATSVAMILIASYLIVSIVNKYPIQASPSGYAHASETNSPNEDKTASDALVKIVKDENPTAAFVELRERMVLSPGLSVRCHSLTHAIGDAAYAKYGSFKDAIRFNDDLCGSGYLHSLIVNVLKQTEDPETVMGSLCAGQDGYCYHGIGHGLMFHTRNDVPLSLKYCAGLDTSEHAARCSEGVYMQNFEDEDEQSYAAPYAYADDPLRLCREETRFKSACYLYAGRYLAKARAGGEDIFIGCRRSETAWYHRCVNGVGTYAMAMHLDDPKEAEHVCVTGKTRSIADACIDGLVSYHLVNYASILKTEEFCGLMDEPDEDACRKSLASREDYYR